MRVFKETWDVCAFCAFFPFFSLAGKSFGLYTLNKFFIKKRGTTRTFVCFSLFCVRICIINLSLRVNQQAHNTVHTKRARIKKKKMGIRTYSSEITNGRNPLSLKQEEPNVDNNNNNKPSSSSGKRPTSGVESIFKNDSVEVGKEFKENVRTWNVNRERGHSGHGIFSQKTPPKFLKVPVDRKKEDDAQIGGGVVKPVDLKQLTLQELRTACRERKVNPAGSKDALVERLEEAVKSGFCKAEFKTSTTSTVGAGVRFDDRQKKGFHWNTSKVRLTSELHQQGMYKGNEIFSSNFTDDRRQTAHTRVVGNANVEGGGVLPSSSSAEQKGVAAGADFSFHTTHTRTKKEEQEQNPPQASEARMKYWDSARGHDLFGSWTQPTAEGEEEEEEDDEKEEQAATPKMMMAPPTTVEDIVQEEVKEEEKVEKEEDIDEYKRRQTMSLEEMKLLRSENDAKLPSTPSAEDKEEEGADEEYSPSPAKTVIFTATKAEKNSSPVFMCPKSPYHAYLNGSDNEEDDGDDDEEAIRLADQAVREVEEELKAESFESSLNITEEGASPTQ